MASLSEVQERVAGAASLPELLDASYDAFEVMLAVLREHDDPGGEFFVPMVMAGAWAASGRDHACWAPSLPPERQGQGSPAGSVGPVTASGATRWLGGLCEVLADRLARAAESAADPDDRDRCAGAAECAREIRALMVAGRA